MRYAADLHLFDGALADRRICSQRVLALLHARAACAQSTASEPSVAWHHRLTRALAAYASARPAGAGSAVAVLELTTARLHQFAASSAPTLGESGYALEHFTAAITHHELYDTAQELRDAAVYLARQAEVHLALGDIDSALKVDTVGGIDRPHQQRLR